MRFWRCPGFAVAEFGAVTRALLAIARDGVDDRGLAMRICRACVDGLGVDGAAISLLTASVARQTLAATDETADLPLDLLLASDHRVELALAGGRGEVCGRTDPTPMTSDLGALGATARALLGGLLPW
jgi:hypothetical protein